MTIWYTPMPQLLDPPGTTYVCERSDGKIVFSWTHTMKANGTTMSSILMEAR